MNTSIRSLNKGEYLAPEYSNFDANGLLIGHTKYAQYTKTGVWHRHKNPLISYVLNGGNVENRKGKSIERVSGSINFYHANEPHQNTYKTFPSRHISIEIEDDFLLKNELSIVDVSLLFQTQKMEAFQFVKILKETTIADDQSKETIEMLFLELCEKAKFQNARDSAKTPIWVDTIRDILHDRWNEKVTLEELAKETGVHPITISKNFRKYFSYTLGEYCRILRIRKALEFISTNKLPLSEIAYVCGFADQSHFIRIFKSLTGFIPKDYRKI